MRSRRRETSLWGRQAVRSVAGLAALAFTAIGTAGVALAQELPPPPYVAQPKAWELDLQPSAAIGMDMLTHLHDVLLVIITVICVFVLALLVYVMVRFRADRNPTPSAVVHNTTLEVAWTLIPILILVGIAIPSFRLLYFTDKIEQGKADLTVKVTGHQWYWSYEYPDHKAAGGEALNIDSRMIPDKDIDPKKGQVRLLSVDNELVVPVNSNVRVIMTSTDVMHGWAVPAFGMKRTVIPGRLNETWFNATKEGLFYGQCSQICGKDHSYMPIAVRVVSKDLFAKWMDARKKQASLDGAAGSSVAALPARQ